MSRAALQTGLKAALAAGRVIGLHVRHGDACSSFERDRMARSCSPLSAYMPYVQRMAKRLKTNVVYLATDSALVVAEASKRYTDFQFLHLSNVSRTATYLQRPPELWDARIRRWTKRGEYERSHDEAWLASLDAFLLARSDAFIGKFTSNLFRAAYSLASGACRCFPPFVSLDAPWCFDYGMLSGSNWAFPSLSPASRSGSDPMVTARAGAESERQRRMHSHEQELAFPTPDRFEC